MKLKGHLRRPRALQEICMALAALRKTCQIRFDRSQVQFVSALEDSMTQVWSSLATSMLFREYHVSANNDQNMIGLEINIEELSRALRSGLSRYTSEDIFMIRLRRYDGYPWLEVAYQESAVGIQGKNSFIQALPVRLIKMSEMDSIHEPQCPPLNVYVQLPSPVSSLLKICERYRHLGKRVLIGANNSRQLSFAVVGDDVKVETTWTGVQNMRPETADDEQPADSEKTFHVNLDAREWFNVLQINAVTKKIVAGIGDNYCLILYCYINDPEEPDADDSMLTYYMSHYED